jgi:Ca-activated chloride channel homolog
VIYFAQPGYLGLGVVVLLMAAGAVYIARWRQRARAEFAGPQASRWGGSGFWTRSLLFILAAGLLAVAAARPQWGTVETLREREGIDYVIALDISKSMNATDVQPTRLATAQDELVRLVQSERGSRIGLVLFAGSAFLRSPLTSDTQAMTQLIQRADSEAGLTRVGSSLGAALDVAGTILEAGDADRGKAVILVSDGEDFTGSYLASAQALKQEGITVLTAGIGTTTGAQLYDEDFLGDPTPKLDENGQPVISRLNESTLKAIADATGGRYQAISDDSRSLLGLRIDLRSLDPTPLGTERSIIPVERYQLFVVAAMVLLLAAWFLPAHLPLPRLRRVRSNPALALLFLTLLIGACGGNNNDSLRARNEQANRLFAAGDYEGALAAYQELLAQRPDVDELSYNAGNALHLLESYERAVIATSRALPPHEVSLGVATYYSLGNHYLKLGQLDQAYAAYRSALLLDPNDADSKYNLEVTLRLALAQQQPPDTQPGSDQTGDSQPNDGGTPVPSDQQNPSGQPDVNASPQDGSPEPGAAGGVPDDATPEATPSSAASLQRSLAEALAGIDENLTFEQAVEILDLLRQQQQQPQSAPGGSSGPDY